MELTTEQKDIAKAAREFAEKEFRDRAKEFDEKEEGKGEEPLHVVSTRRPACRRSRQSCSRRAS